MKVFVRVRVKTWAYLMDYDSGRAKGTEVKEQKSVL